MSIWIDMLDAKIDYVSVGTYRTRYAVAGEGEPLLLVHGTGGHIENYSKVFPILAEHYRVYVLDMIGYGLTEKPMITYDVPAWGNHVFQFIEQVIQQPVTIVGHSLGGWISAWIGLNHPHWIRNIVLLCAVGFEYQHHEGEAMMKFHDFHLQSCLHISKESLWNRFRILVSDERLIPDEWIELRLKMFTRPDFQAVMKHWVDYIPDLVQSAEKVKPYLLNAENAARLDQPVLVISGEKDHLTPVQTIERVMPHFKRGKWRQLKGVGHWPQLESPEELCNVILSFFNTNK